MSVISIQELAFQAMALMSSTFFPFEIWITITGIYMLLTLTGSLAVDRMGVDMRKSKA